MQLQALLWLAWLSNPGAASDGADLSSLLQLDARARLYLKRRPKQCLKFVHIPKTGGSSIDSANMHQETPVFDSLMRDTYLRIAEDMPDEEFQSKYGGDLGTMYDESHRSSANYSHEWIPLHGHSYRLIDQPDGGTCEDLHTPPSDNATVELFYKNCTTFCAVREPLQRFISAYEMSTIGPCDTAGFEERVSSFLLQLDKEPSSHMCLFVPQVQYIFGAKSQSLSNTTYCDHILHSEHLDEEFASFMHEMGETLTLTDHHAMSEEAYSGCRVDRKTVSQTAKDLIYEHYRADYDAFGYSRP